jgi:chromosome segregation ATPase
MKYPTLQQSLNATAVALVVFAVAFFGTKFVKSYNHNKEAVATLTAQVASKDTEIGTLRENLSETEEGKRQVEEAKRASDANAAAQTRRASTAEADASAKAAQLSTTTAQLNTANTQLAGVNRCIALFNSTKPKIESFKVAIGNQNDWANAGNYSLAGYYTDQANSLWQQIWPTMDRIATGYCY